MPNGRLRGHSLALASLLAVSCAHAAATEAELPKPTPPASASVAASLSKPPGIDEREGVVSEPPPEASPEATPAPKDEPPAAEHDFQKPLPPRELARDAPSVQAANLTPAACLAELRRRNLTFERDTGPASGVAVPVRITGPFRSVRFVTPGRKSVYGKLDCRLALVLDELAGVLERHGVVAMRVDNFYRPKAHLPGRRTSSQHRYGLAADIVSFELADGTELSLERDWHGERGTAPCGPEARLLGPSAASVALRDLVCDIARSGLFHHILTPSYNEAHRDHVHMDIKRGAKRSIIE